MTSLIRSRAVAVAALLGTMVLSDAAHSQTGGKIISPIAPAEAPLSLTASDGAGLELVSLSANAVIEDPLAFTELHLVFRNPEPRVREGRFRITLPEGATVSRFAMLIGSTWQEGEVVELQAARRAYEDFLHRRQDPALLETEAGNEFSARVFPIPAGATKELVISYSQELVRSDQKYRLPLRGLPKMQALRVRALVGKSDVAAAASSLGGRMARHEVVEVDKRDFLPDRDFEVSAANPRLGLRSDNLVVARIAPLGMNASGDRQQPISSLVVLFDTSASRALGFADQVGKLRALAAELAKHGDPVMTVVAFDQLADPLFTGKASGLSDHVLAKLRERRALGASDLGLALSHVAGLSKQGHRIDRVLVMSDGVATAGETAAEKLRAIVKSLGASGVQRLDALAVGGIRDTDLLSGLVSAGLDSDGVVVDSALAPAEQVRKLLSPTRSALSVDVPGAAWVWPQTLHGVQPGDQVLIYADLPAAAPLRLKVGGKDLPLGQSALVPAERALLERAWVKARISRVLAQRDTLAGGDRDLAEALRKQAIELSTRYRVLCPYTALLVLETDADYARFGIERKALADILTVGAEGITVLARRDFPTVSAPPPAEPEWLRARDRGQQDLKAKRGAPEATMQDVDLADKEVAALAPKPSVASNRPVVPSPEPAKAPAPPPAPSVVAPTAAPAPVMKQAEQAEATDDLMSASERPVREERDSRRRARSGPALVRPPRLQQPPRQDLAAGALASDGLAQGVAPYEGELKDVMDLLARKEVWKAMVKARDWRERDPGDVLALVAIGEAAEASNDTTLASRAYGSIIDLFPGRADLRRYAGQRLEHVHDGRALSLAVDTYRKAALQRPDHPASHRLLGMALLKLGHAQEAFEALATGVDQHYPDGRFAGADRILREDLALAAAAWIRGEPGRRAQIAARLQAKTGLHPDNKPSLRFVLVWETDANDVDFHIIDKHGHHAYFGNRSLPSGGELYADVTTGYGPECFTIPLPASTRSYPYKLQAHYYSRGPMGYGMGKLQIVEHDGKGGLRFEERPYLVMRDGAFVDLGKVAGPLGSSQ
jgi:tetratricopeptide (TPR) repeat protein